MFDPGWSTNVYQLVDAKFLIAEAAARIRCQPHSLAHHQILERGLHVRERRVITDWGIERNLSCALWLSIQLGMNGE